MKRFYGVRKGFSTGIFTSYENVQRATQGYSGAEYRGFATRKEAEANLTPEPFELIIYEEDGSGYVYHKVLYNKETKVYHEYRYHYDRVPGYGYMTLDYIEFIVYDKNSIVISTEVQK